MSLDVWLTRKYHVSYDNGNTLEERSEEVYEANITHNLNEMADACGIYEALWRPEEINAEKGGDIIDLLQKGYEKLVADPKHYEQFNSPNGWGMYGHFVPFVKKYLDACIEFPEATIGISR
jgi:hypothetical protein